MIKPTVSVLMVTYNHEKFIRDAIEGILIQKTTFPFELVIGEDHSTDSTREICKEYEKKNQELVRILDSEKNLGGMPNFIRSFNECKGKYIALCEGDDYWTDPYKLQKQTDFLELHEDFAMVHTAKTIICNEEVYPGNLREVKSGIIIEDLLDDNLVSTLTVMIRSEIYKDAIRTALPEAQKHSWKMFDYPVWLEIALNYKIGFINEDTGVYRIIPESYSHTSDTRKEYLFGKSYVDIKEYYFKKYLDSNAEISRSFKLKFRENNFHARKSLLFNYGLMAIGELKILLKTTPWFYFYLIYSKIKRVLEIKSDN
jgi:glycosyltransferase involved in cell wall biosynthesis